MKMLIMSMRVILARWIDPSAVPEKKYRQAKVIVRSWGRILFLRVKISIQWPIALFRTNERQNILIERGLFDGTKQLAVRCPFHHEITPSLTMPMFKGDDYSWGSWYCFGCDRFGHYYHAGTDDCSDGRARPDGNRYEFYELECQTHKRWCWPWSRAD